MRIFIAILLGAILGGVIARFLFVGSGWSLLPWGLVGLGTGIFARDKKEAVVSGALYGFVLSFLFMIGGYTGSQPLVTRFPAFGILGLVGAFCGGVLGLIGAVARQAIRKDTLQPISKRG